MSCCRLIESVVAAAIAAIDSACIEAVRFNQENANSQLDSEIVKA
jgi:hypothetical protein